MEVNVSYKDPMGKDGISVNLKKKHIFDQEVGKPPILSDHPPYRDFLLVLSKWSVTV